MKSWRIRLVVHGIIVAGLLCMIGIYKKAIQDFHSGGISTVTYEYDQPEASRHGTPHRTRSRSLGFRDGIIVRRSERKTTAPIVVAPWTTLGKKTSRSHGKKGEFELRSFVFVEPAKLDSEYGVPMTTVDKNELEKIKREASRRLCARSKKSSENGQATLRCKENLDLLRCVSCSERDGTWYTAVSETGARKFFALNSWRE